MNSLSHHGIMGQRWGKRNGPPYPLRESAKSSAEKHTKQETKNKKSHGIKWGDLTDEQKKKYIKTGVIIAGVALAYAGLSYVDYRTNKLTRLPFTSFEYGEKIDLSKVSDAVKTISKDTVLQRISSSPAEDMIKEGKAIYASYLKEDNAVYKYNMPNFIEEWYNKGQRNSKDAFVNKIKLKKEVKLASEKAVMEAYMKANKVNDVDKGHFQSFMTYNLLDRENPVTKEFLNELKAKGFDGLFDYNDTNNGMSKAPLYLFNLSEIIDSVNSHKLGKLEKFINILAG